MASVPRQHVYVRHISWPGDGVEQVASPGATNRAVTVMDPGWAAAHDVDCFHTHFGFGEVEPDVLRRWLEVLDGRGIGLVHTVHDLANPHRTDLERHRAQLDLLVPAADAVVTLTASAASEIRRRWGRDARVLPHPHVVDLPDVGRSRARRCGLRIGLHCKDMRAGYEVAGTLRPLLRYVAGRAGARLFVDVYPAAEARLAAVLGEQQATVERLLDAGRLVVRVSPFFTDRRFTAYVRSIDVAVLPYRVGTHSGWAEACADVGTEVVVTDQTHVHHQHPWIRVVPLLEDGVDEATLTAELDAVAGAGRTCHVTREAREVERRALSAAHRAVYEEVAATP